MLSWPSEWRTVVNGMLQLEATRCHH